MAPTITAVHNDGQKPKGGKFKKNKKGKKFLANAKGFAKQGIFGRGSHIEESDFTYFLNIMNALRNGFETIEEKVAMANNVIGQTEGKEILLAQNQVVSKVLEALLGFVDGEHLERFLNAFAGNFRPICSDKFASHVVQKTVEIAFLRAVAAVAPDADDAEPVQKKGKIVLISETDYNKKADFSDEHREQCAEFVVKTTKFLLNNLEDFISDSYGSHILRTCVYSLGGIHVPKIAFDNNKNNSAPAKHARFAVPSDWTDVVREFANRLVLWPQFPTLPYTEFSSILLGTICLSLKEVDNKLLQTFGKKILTDSFLAGGEQDDESKLPKVFESAPSTRLLETLLSVAGPKLYTQIKTQIFENRLLTLAKDPRGNFAVQSLIEHTQDKAVFEGLFNELSDHIEELLKLNHAGVVTALSDSCLRLQTLQGKFVSALQAALQVTDVKENPEKLFKAVVKLTDKTQSVNSYGSRIAQNILNFNKPISFVNSILATTPADIVAIFNTAAGSYIADAFIKSKFVGEKSREKLIKHLEGTYLDLAKNKYGSRVIEKFFESAGDSQKTKIMKELSESTTQLNSNMYGRVVSSKLRVETFRLSPAQWKAALDKPSKAEKLFKDIVA